MSSWLDAPSKMALSYSNIIATVIKLNHSQNASKIDELKVTDDIVDDIKDSIECHLDWFSTWFFPVALLSNISLVSSNKLKSSEDNAKPLNKSLFTADCDDCDFKSLRQTWRYLSAKDFVRIDERFRSKTLPKL